MQKLTKKDRKHFDLVCLKIREALHLEHWKFFYQFEKSGKNCEDGRDAAATFHVQVGRRIHISFWNGFWEADGEEQLRALIHEHCHAMQNGYMYVVKEMTRKAVHSSEWEQWRERFNHENEQCTDHLESVLFDLLSDRF